MDGVYVFFSLFCHFRNNLRGKSKHKNLVIVFLFAWLSLYGNTPYHHNNSHRLKPPSYPLLPSSACALSENFQVVFTTKVQILCSNSVFLFYIFLPPSLIIVSQSLPQYPPCYQIYLLCCYLYKRHLNNRPDYWDKKRFHSMIFNFGENPTMDVIRMLMHYVSNCKKIPYTESNLFYISLTLCMYIDKKKYSQGWESKNIIKVFLYMDEIRNLLNSRHFKFRIAVIYFHIFRSNLQRKILDFTLTRVNIKHVLIPKDKRVI